jgi:flavin-dependent dehydrogenase
MSLRGDDNRLGPLTDGQTVAVIGGGPGGIGCALALRREADKRNLRLRIVVFEGKRFGVHYNQCAGVLSPPLQQILRDNYALELPPEMIEREIKGYVLHSENKQIVLSGAEYGGSSLAVRRVQFDDLLERTAKERGIEIVQARATDLEFRNEEVVVFSWGGTLRAAAVVGAFGLSRAMTATLSRRTRYRPPSALDAMVTNFRPHGRDGGRVPSLLDDHIHVLLPPLKRIEFGAIIPKGNHLTVILAGENVRTDDMNAFLDLPPVHRLIPTRPEPDDYFKGRFPISLARHPFGDRYVTLGDAAGLVRPFKGKGINSAMITGGLAAQTMFDAGVSRRAFQGFYRQCSDITADMLYGKLIRKLTGLSAHGSFMDRVLDVAEHEPAMRELLFDCVSGRETYRKIVLRQGNAGLAARLGGLYLLDRLQHPFG